MANTNLTANFFGRLCRVIYLFGIPYLWIDDIGYSKFFLRCSWYINKILSVFYYLFVGSEVIGLFTQTHLSEKQSTDQLVFGITHPILITYYVSVEYYKENVKVILQTLAIDFKNVYNDKDVEKKMIRKSKFYSIAYLCSFSSALISYGFDGLMQVLHGDGTFTTIVTAWPDANDRSTSACLARIASYIIWWLFMARVSAIYVLVVSLTICLNHQYKNLQSYFYRLVEIFDDNDLSQIDKEMEYERSLKIGIKLHSDTLWCTKQFQTACSAVFSGQIIITIYVLCLLMLQMVNSDRTLMNTLPIVTTGATMLISTGFYMWNAGDVTEEAALLPTVMYCSGWENCQRNSSKRIRRLLFVAMAMAQSQRPVILRSFGIIELSYELYLSIVKSSYSAFSLLY